MEDLPIKLGIRDQIKMISFISGYTKGNMSGHCSSPWLTWSETSISICFSLFVSLLISLGVFFSYSGIDLNILYLLGSSFLISLLAMISVHFTYYHILIREFYTHASKGEEILKHEISKLSLLFKMKKFSKELCFATESLEGEAFSIEEILIKDNISLFNDLSQMIIEDIEND